MADFREFGRGHTRMMFEGPGEVALIRKTSSKSDLNQRSIRFGQLMAGELNTPLPDILSDGAAIVLPEHASQMDRMNTN